MNEDGVIAIILCLFVGSHSRRRVVVAFLEDAGLLLGVGKTGKPVGVPAFLAAHFPQFVDYGLQLLVDVAAAGLGETQLLQPVLELLQQTDHPLLHVIHAAQSVAL